MQQPPPQPSAAHPMGAMPPVSPANITTEQIQKYLDENKQLILAILDNQNLGKLSECAQYQAQLQKNLLYLAAIADAQPQTPTVRPQMPPQVIPHATVQQGGHYAQQSALYPPRATSQFNPQVMQEQQQLHQLQHQPQLFHGQMGLRSGVMNGMHSGHAEASLGGPTELPRAPEFLRGSGSTPSSSVDGRGSKKDAGGAASESPATADGQRSSATEHGSSDAEPSNTRKPEDNKTP